MNIIEIMSSMNQLEIKQKNVSFSLSLENENDM